MASIQARKSRGHKYWYIVESRRVNGKPRPIVLEYLGKADNLLQRLRELKGHVKLKSYSHGAVAALLNIAQQLNIPNEINRHIQSQRKYMTPKPIRNNLTAGITLLLGAIGRVCMPGSKRAWWSWAKTTSCEYLLRSNLGKMDSQHFWDLMDALPVSAIEKIEQSLIRRICAQYDIKTDSLFYDTTNFFTYIHTTNARCTIAQRGKNKQRRADLRQVGLAMIVTKEDLLPLFHLTYQGNLHDSKVFAHVIGKIKTRMVSIGLDPGKHTLVFDRGNNSKENMETLRALGLQYVGALTPCQHKKLMENAGDNYEEVFTENRQTLMVRRSKMKIWNEERTVLVFVSDRLKEGQMRGIYHDIEKKEKAFRKIYTSMNNPKGKKHSREKWEEKIEKITTGQYMKGLFCWTLKENKKGGFDFNYSLSKEKLGELEEELGFRIIMTSRHEWSSAEIIGAYYGQSKIEKAFKDIKNPHHLALRPQHHWTDQKITVHFFICVLGYLLSTLLYRQAKSKIGFNSTMNTMLEMLNNVRLGTILEVTGKKGRMKANYKLEEMSEQENDLMEALEIMDYHEKKAKIDGVGVYN